jgi:hypothetical protein
MASATAICTSYKVDLLFGRHNFAASGGDSFRVALYTSSATNGAATTAYSASNEVTGTAYVAKGNALTNIDPVSSGTTAYTDFPDTTWSTSTITAASCLIYNDSATTPTADASVQVHDFGGDKTSTGADFTIQFPAAASGTAIIRIA